MRAAPAVRVHARRAGAWRWIQAALFGIAAMAASAWALAHAGQAPWPAVPAALVASVVAWRFVGQPEVDLTWDGQTWTAGGEPGVLSVMLDLGGWMLLRLRPAESGRSAIWIPVAANECGADWHRLRAAAHAAVEPARGAR